METGLLLGFEIGLKLGKVCPAVLFDRDQLSVNNDVWGKLGHRIFQERELFNPVQPTAGVEVRLFLLPVKLHAVAVELHLIQPGTCMKPVIQSGELGFDKTGHDVSSS